MKILLCKVVLLPALLLMMIGCSSGDPPYLFESPFVTALTELSKKGPRNTRIHLNTLTNFSWDQVFYFNYGSSKEEINEIIGARLFGDDFLKSFLDNGIYFQQGPLLVFMKGGSVAHAVSITPPVYFSGTDKANYSYSSARIISKNDDPGPYVFGFIE